MPKTIAITGAAGFVGGFLVDYFFERGYVIYAFGRRANFTKLDKVKEYIKWDITLGPLKPVAKIDAVIHCAGSVSHWGDPDQMYQANVIGTKNVIQSFPDSKIIHISTASVYDPLTQKNQIKEDQPRPKKYLNHYQLTKWQGEQVVIINSNNYIILRPHIIYGPGDTTIYPRLMKAKRSLIQRFIVLGNGQNFVSTTFVGNLAKATELAIESKVSNQVYNVTDQNSAKLREILDVFRISSGINYKYLFIPKFVAWPLASIVEVLYKTLRIQSEPIITRYIVSQMCSNYTINIDRIVQQLGYQSPDNFKNTFQTAYGNQNLSN